MYFGSASRTRKRRSDSLTSILPGNHSQVPSVAITLKNNVVTLSEVEARLVASHQLDSQAPIVAFVADERRRKHQLDELAGTGGLQPGHE
jgi:hypothetical protein